MRTLTVDTDGVFFSLRIFVVVSLLVGVWYAWVPLQQHSTLNAQTANAIGNSVMNGGDTSGMVDTRGSAATEFGVSALAATTVPTQGIAVRIDLSDKTVELHKDGTIVYSAAIDMVPAFDAPNAVREGSYTVDFTSEVQLSTVTLTRFPYYIKFGDRYALHGIPTGANGEMLEGSQGGGSIQIATKDAKKMYEYLSEGATVVVYTTVGGVTTNHSSRLEVSPGDLPATSASSYALTDVETGQTFIVKNGSDRYPVASITKFVTAVVTTDVIEHGTEVQSSNGQYYAVGDLYYPLLLRSDNGVAHSLARHIGTTEFIANMNTYVRAVGMQNTSFADSSGLSPKNISSAHDLTLLARHLFNTKRFILDISSEEDMTITSRTGVRWSMTNQNKLAADPHFRGGKLGYTDEAGQTSLALFTIPIDGETHLVAVVVLGSKDWKQDTRTLLRWLVQSVTVAE